MRYGYALLLCVSFVMLACLDSERTSKADIRLSTISVLEPGFAVHDPSNILEVAPNVYTAFTSTHPDQSHHMRQLVLDMNEENPAWHEVGHWPIEPRGENPIPQYDVWMLPWWEEYGYDSSLIEHTESATVAPTMVDASTVYFHLYNNAGRTWAEQRGLEPAMYAAIFRAVATGVWPQQQWTMEPIPVYYSDTETFNAGGPRAVDAHVWNDNDGQMYMTFGSWDPANQNVIVITDMNESTGRIEGFDVQTPGYYDSSNPVFHPVATFGEGAQSYRYGDYYYLFINLGGCCAGVESSYFIVVGRSTNVYGPYVDDQGRRFMDVYSENDLSDGRRFPGKLVLRGEGAYIGPGHTGIYEHPDGRLAISFHYYDAEDNGKSKFTTRELAFDQDGWPYVVSDRPFDFSYRDNVWLPLITREGDDSL